MPTQTAQTSVLERFSQISPQEWESEVDQLWQALDAIKKTVTQQVSTDRISPITGLGILACASGQIFGYQAFHNQPTHADLLGQMRSN